MFKFLPLAIHVQVFQKWLPCQSSHEAEVRPENLRHPKQEQIDDVTYLLSLSRVDR